MHGLLFMKDDYDAVSIEIVAWLHCCVTGSRLFAVMLLLIVILLLGGDNRRIADGVSGPSVCLLGNALGDKKSGVLGG
jgi:hypothetical protein